MTSNWSMIRIRRVSKGFGNGDSFLGSLNESDFDKIYRNAAVIFVYIFPGHRCRNILRKFSAMKDNGISIEIWLGLIKEFKWNKCSKRTHVNSLLQLRTYDVLDLKIESVIFLLHVMCLRFMSFFQRTNDLGTKEIAFVKKKIWRYSESRLM